MERSMEDLYRKALEELFRNWPYLFEWISPDLRGLLKDFFKETQEKAKVESKINFEKLLEKVKNEENYDYCY